MYKHYNNKIFVFDEVNTCTKLCLIIITEYEHNWLFYLPKTVGLGF